jgi:hypothetical protein
MGYFTRFADAAFKSGPDGERLFYLYGPWSRPYILPDAATEHRLWRKLLWYYRIVLTIVLLAALSFQRVVPNLWSSFYFQVFAIVMLTLAIGSLKLTFHSDTRRLTLSPTRALSTFFDNIADKTSYRTLSLRFLACLLFVGVGIAMIVLGQSVLNMSVTVAFFTLCAIAVGFVMLRKRARST